MLKTVIFLLLFGFHVFCGIRMNRSDCVSSAVWFSISWGMLWIGSILAVTFL